MILKNNHLIFTLSPLTPLPLTHNPQTHEPKAPALQPQTITGLPDAGDPLAGSSQVALRGARASRFFVGGLQLLDTGFWS